MQGVCPQVTGFREKLMSSAPLTQLAGRRLRESRLAPGHSWPQACCRWDLGRVSALQRPVAPGLEALHEAKGSDIHLR